MSEETKNKKKRKKQKVRVDKKRNTTKIVKYKYENPDSTIRETAEATGLGVGTVHSISKELEKNGTKDETISYIVEESKKTLKLISQAITATARAVIEEDFDVSDNGEITMKEGNVNMGMMRMKDLVKIAEKADSRIQLFGGNATDENGGIDIKYVVALPERK